MGWGEGDGLPGMSWEHVQGLYTMCLCLKQRESNADPVARLRLGHSSSRSFMGKSKHYRSVNSSLDVQWLAPVIVIRHCSLYPSVEEQMARV